MKFTKKIFFSFGILFLFFAGMKAQKTRLLKDGPNDKYFVAFSYGVGNASWNSKINSGALYDTSGAEMFAGNINFKAKNSYKSYNVDVLVPVGNIRLGMGLCFEDFYLQKIKINSYQYYFSEKFRFEKMYAQVEIPIEKWSNAHFTFNVKSQAGYYGFSYINHINLFGSDSYASVLFMNTGFLVDYKMYPHMYGFVHPVFEYKYFRTNASERPTVIVHNIFTYGIQFGIRFDVSRE